MNPLDAVRRAAQPRNRQKNGPGVPFDGDVPRPKTPSPTRSGSTSRATPRSTASTARSTSRSSGPNSSLTGMRPKPGQYGPTAARRAQAQEKADANARRLEAAGRRRSKGTTGTATSKPKAAATTKTKGGNYPAYKKDSAKAKDFRSAYAAAREAGNKTFSWDGRSYNTRQKGESDAAWAKALKKAKGTDKPAAKTTNKTNKTPKRNANQTKSGRVKDSNSLIGRMTRSTRVKNKTRKP